MRMERALKGGGDIIMNTNEMADLQLAIQYAIKHEKAELTWIQTILKMYSELEGFRARIAKPEIFNPDE